MPENPDLAELLESSGAILRGHFILSSGRHSPVYFEKFRVLEQPHVLSALCAQIAQKFQGQIDLVAGPTTGGIIIAFETARQLRLPALYVESVDGVKMIRRNATVPPNARILVVDDVLTTGLSIRETIAALHREGGQVAAAAVLIDRSNNAVDFGIPLFSAHTVEAPSYAPHEIPPDLAQIPPSKPGTRSP